MKWDVFICHASEDKKGLVRGLAEGLKHAGLRVWYDEFSLSIGDSLRRSIDKGLAKSNYGIVVLSPSFFKKEWPQKELDALVGKEADGKKVILPSWHRIGRNEVAARSPLLADRVALRSDIGIEKLVDGIQEAMSGNGLV